MSNHTAITEELTIIMKEIGERASRATKELNRANQNNGEGKTRQIKKISKSLGEDLLEIASEIKEKNNSQHEILVTIEDSL